MFSNYTLDQVVNRFLVEEPGHQRGTMIAAKGNARGGLGRMAGNPRANEAPPREWLSWGLQGGPLAKKPSAFSRHERISTRGLRSGHDHRIGPSRTTIEFDQAGRRKFVSSIVRLRAATSPPRSGAREGARRKRTGRRDEVEEVGPNRNLSPPPHRLVRIETTHAPRSGHGARRRPAVSGEHVRLQSCPGHRSHDSLGAVLVRRRGPGAAPLPALAARSRRRDAAGPGDRLKKADLPLLLAPSCAARSSDRPS